MVIHEFFAVTVCMNHNTKTVWRADNSNSLVIEDIYVVHMNNWEYILLRGVSLLCYIWTSIISNNWKLKVEKIGSIVISSNINLDSEEKLWQILEIDEYENERIQIKWRLFWFISEREKKLLKRNHMSWIVSLMTELMYI